MKNRDHYSSNLIFTNHMQTRMQQRSFSQTDVHLIIRYGTAINDEEIYLANKDAQCEIFHLRCRIKIIQRRLNNSRISRCGTEAISGSLNPSSEIARLHRQIQAIDRLKNRKVVLKGNHVVTCYSCTKSELKRISKIRN